MWLCFTCGSRVTLKAFPNDETWYITVSKNLFNPASISWLLRPPVTSRRPYFVALRSYRSFLLPVCLKNLTEQTLLSFPTVAHRSTQTVPIDLTEEILFISNLSCTHSVASSIYTFSLRPPSILRRVISTPRVLQGSPWSHELSHQLQHFHTF